MTGILTSVAMIGATVFVPWGASLGLTRWVPPFNHYPPGVQRQVRQMGARFSITLGAFALFFFLVAFVAVVAHVLGHRWG